MAADCFSPLGGSTRRCVGDHALAPNRRQQRGQRLSFAGPKAVSEVFSHRRCFFTSGRWSTGPWLQPLRFYLTRSKRSLRCLRFLLFKNLSLHPHHPWVPRSGFNASRFNDLASRSIFPRNEPPNPAKYFSEGPEMTSHDEEPKEGRNNNT